MVKDYNVTQPSPSCEHYLNTGKYYMPLAGSTPDIYKDTILGITTRYVVYWNSGQEPN